MKVVELCRFLRYPDQTRCCCIVPSDGIAVSTDMRAVIFGLAE